MQVGFKFRLSWAKFPSQPPVYTPSQQFRVPVELGDCAWARWDGACVKQKVCEVSDTDRWQGEGRRREIGGAWTTWKWSGLCEVQDGFRLERGLPWIRSSSGKFYVPIWQGWGSALSSLHFFCPSCWGWEARSRIWFMVLQSRVSPWCEKSCPLWIVHVSFFISASGQNPRYFWAPPKEVKGWHSSANTTIFLERKSVQFFIPLIVVTCMPQSHYIVTISPDPQTFSLQGNFLPSLFWRLILPTLVHSVLVLLSLGRLGTPADFGVNIESHKTWMILFCCCCYGGLCDRCNLSRLTTFLSSESGY